MLLVKIDNISRKPLDSPPFDPKKEIARRLELSKSGHCEFLRLHVRDLKTQKLTNHIGICLKNDSEYPKHITKGYCMAKQCEKIEVKPKKRLPVIESVTVVQKPTSENPFLVPEQPKKKQIHQLKKNAPKKAKKTRRSKKSKKKPQVKPKNSLGKYFA